MPYPSLQRDAHRNKNSSLSRNATNQNQNLSAVRSDKEKPECTSLISSYTLALPVSRGFIKSKSLRIYYTKDNSKKYINSG